MNNETITITKEDWDLLANIMRSITWGKDCADDWRRLYNKVLNRSKESDLQSVKHHNR